MGQWRSLGSPQPLRTCLSISSAIGPACLRNGGWLTNAPSRAARTATHRFSPREVAIRGPGSLQGRGARLLDCRSSQAIEVAHTQRRLLKAMLRPSSGPRIRDDLIQRLARDGHRCSVVFCFSSTIIAVPIVGRVAERFCKGMMKMSRAC